MESVGLRDFGQGGLASWLSNGDGGLRAVEGTEKDDDEGGEVDLSDAVQGQGKFCWDKTGTSDAGRVRSRDRRKPTCRSILFVSWFHLTPLPAKALIFALH